MSISGASKAVGAVAGMLLAAATLRGQQTGGRRTGAGRFVSIPKRGRADQRHGDGDRRERAFVPGLRQEDFTIYERHRPQTVTHFSSERVPVGLGIVSAPADSMAGDKIQAARAARRFLFDLLDRNDEIFLYRFANDPGPASELDVGSVAAVARSGAAERTAARRYTTPWPRSPPAGRGGKYVKKRSS